MVAGVKGSGAPVIVDAGEIDGVVAESPDEGGDFFLVCQYTLMNICANFQLVGIFFRVVLKF